MERYILFIFYGLSAEEVSFLSNYFGPVNATSGDPLAFYHFSYVYILNLKKRWKKHVEWKEANNSQEIIDLISKCFLKEGDNEDVYDSIAECINSLADHLPSPGTFILDVFAGCNIFENFSVSDNVEFAASLHRLSEWHSAHIYYFTFKGTDDTSCSKEWLDLTNAEAININEYSKLVHPFWRGAIEFKQPNISTRCYKGFELRIDSQSQQMRHYLNLIFNMPNESNFLFLHPILKATDLCCFSSIPHHIIFPVPFKLCISRSISYDSSVKLRDKMNNIKDAALILKMGYSVLNEKPKSNKFLSTNKWLKMVSSTNVKFPCFCDSDKYLTLVVIPSADSNEMLAYGIRDGLDAEFYFNMVGIKSKQSSNSHPTEVKELSVPFVSKSLFESSLTKTIDMHADFKESNTSELLNSFIQCSNNFSGYKDFSDVNITLDKVDPSDWVERMHLLQIQMRLDEEQKNKRNVFMSFSPKRSRYYVSFSGDDIQKYFEPSGDAKANKIAEPIQTLGCSTNYNKDNLEIIKYKKWPDILNCVYDDIYYNVTKQSEEMENVGSEMVKCYVQHETASTCNNDQDQPDAPITIQAKSMTPRKRPKSTSKLGTSLRQVIMNPNTSTKLLNTVHRNPVISTIMKTLGVPSNEDQNKKPRKNKLPIRCSPRKKSSIDYYSASKIHNSTKVQKNKTLKEKSSHSIPEILKKKLRSSIALALESNGVNMDDVLFKPCFKRLFTICQAFIQEIQDNPRKSGTSQYIQDIAEEHVKPVIKFEKQKRKIE